MKVLLINPKYSEVYSGLYNTVGVVPPLGLAYLAAYLRANNIDVEVLDAHALRLSLKELETRLSGYDIVGVPSFTPSLDSSLKILRIAKMINPFCKTVMGGPHISALPFETMERHPEIDFGVTGEGEFTILELIKAIQKGGGYNGISGIVHRSNGGLKITCPRRLINNIDKLPPPAYDLLPFDKYSLPLHQGGFIGDVPVKPYALLLSSRGCPYDCTFCGSKIIWRRQVRCRTAANVLSEIDWLISKFNLKVLNITDDNFMLNRARLDEILNGLIERRYNLRFNCLSRADVVDREILEKLKKAGCYLVRFGVESGNEGMLKRMRKNITLEQIVRTFKLTRESGLATSASFIIGNPGETRQSFEDTINFAKKIKPTTAIFFIAAPFPGTDLYSIARKKKLILSIDYSNWKLVPSMPSMRTEELSRVDLANLRRKAYRDFYFRLPYIFERLANIKNISQIKLCIRGFLGVNSLAK